MEWIRGSAIRWIDRFLPKHVKRMIVIASLTSVVQNKTTFSREALRRLNAVMGLCSREDAMKFPMQLSKVIWNGEVIHDVRDKHFFVAGAEDDVDPEVKKAADALIARVRDQVPPWLRYGEKETEADLRKLLSNQHVFS